MPDVYLEAQVARAEIAAARGDKITAIAILDEVLALGGRLKVDASLAEAEKLRAALD